MKVHFRHLSNETRYHDIEELSPQKYDGYLPILSKSLVLGSYHKIEHGLRAAYTSTYASVLACVCMQSTGVTVDADAHGSVKIRPKIKEGHAKHALYRVN
ncbi:MAG: hypothetical protein KKG76_00815 [Euryarchaeota archaeon]|nr:hypothetical protein [Euryarchaeota archaeon]